MMKKLVVLFAPVLMIACGEAKKEEPAMVKKVVCGDSVEQAMYDEMGNVYTVRTPGPCDTILEPAPEH